MPASTLPTAGQVGEVDAALRRTALDLAARVDTLQALVDQAEAERHRIAHAVVDVRAVLADAIRPYCPPTGLVVLDHLDERLAAIVGDLVPATEADRLLEQLTATEEARDG